MSHLTNGNANLVNFTELLDPTPIVTESENSLYRILNDFVSEELLSGLNAYECENCCRKVRFLMKR